MKSRPPKKGFLAFQSSTFPLFRVGGINPDLGNFSLF
jgi:hypothetical protein